MIRENNNNVISSITSVGHAIRRVKVFFKKKRTRSTKCAPRDLSFINPKRREKMR